MLTYKQLNKIQVLLSCWWHCRWPGTVIGAMATAQCMWYVLVLNRGRVLAALWILMAWPGALTPALKRKCHFDEIFITGRTGSCHFDNFQCGQWWKFHQNEDISVSVRTSVITMLNAGPVPQRTRNTINTSLLRQNDAVTSFWRNNDVFIALCVRWDEFNSLAPVRCGS